MNIKPEQLKALAERMGYKVVLENNSVFIQHFSKAGSWIAKEKYNPLTNDSKAMELIVKYKIDLLHFDETVLARCVDEDLSETSKVEREDLKEAVTLAAIAMEEGRWKEKR